MIYKLVPDQYRKWLALLGCFLAHLSLGVYYTFGNMQPYMGSYMREYVGLDVRYAETVWITTLGEVFLSISSIIAGVVYQKYKINLRVIMYFGCFLMSSGVALTYFSVQHSYYMVVITFSGIVGLGVGFGYLGPLSIAMKWFPENKGMANATVLFGFAATALLLGQIQTHYINPTNCSPDKSYSDEFLDEKYFSKEKHIDLLERVPICYLIMSATCFGLQILSFMLVSEPTEQPLSISNKVNEPVELKPFSISESIENAVKVKKEAEQKKNSLGVDYFSPSEGMDYRQVIRHPVFYLLMLIFSLAATSSANILSFYKTFGLTFISDDVFLSVVGSVASISNALARLFWGWAIDKFSCKLTLLTIQTILIALCSTIYMAKIIAVPGIYALWVCLVFFVNSGLSAVFPTIVARTFGQRHFTTIYGICMLAFLGSSTIASGITSIKDYVGWFWFFFIGCSINLISWLASFCYRVTDSKKQDI